MFNFDLGVKVFERRGRKNPICKGVNRLNFRYSCVFHSSTLLFQCMLRLFIYKAVLLSYINRDVAYLQKTISFFV